MVLPLSINTGVTVFSSRIGIGWFPLKDRLELIVSRKSSSDESLFSTYLRWSFLVVFTVVDLQTTLKCPIFPPFCHFAGICKVVWVPTSEARGRWCSSWWSCLLSRLYVDVAFPKSGLLEGCSDFFDFIVWSTLVVGAFRVILFSLMICSFYDLCNLTQFGKVQVLFFKQSLSQLSWGAFFNDLVNNFVIIVNKFTSFCQAT